MHLAIVSPFPPSITGIGQYGYHVSAALAASGAFSRITVLSGGRPRALPGDLQVEKGWRPENAMAGWEIARRIRDLQPDLAWFNLGASVFGRSPLANLSGFLSLQLVRRMGIPTIVTLHELVELADLPALKAPGGPFARYGARLLTSLGLQADVTCLTMQRYIDWLAVHRPTVLSRHIPIGAYHSPELLPAAQTPELLFFTTLAPFKGLEVLLDAFRMLRSSHPGLRLTIAGTEHARFPGYAGILRNQYQGLDGVRWLGQVPEEAVRGLFMDAQVVVLPYNASTGSSSILYQAATWGRPVVASDLPETRAITTESGLDVSFFERGNAIDLANVLQAGLAFPDSSQKQVLHNFAAMQRSLPQDTCRAYLKAFNLALETCRSPKRIQLLPESM